MRRAPLFIACLPLLAAISSSSQAYAEPGTTLTDFPGPGSFTRAPIDAEHGAPRPLLVALHGDGGGALKLFRAWQKACDEAGVVLLVPRCPKDLGCTTGSFWQWYSGGHHDPEWLGAQIAAVTARYPIDPRRVYATGYSGGATYLGWYAPSHATRFAAVAHVAGGMPYGVPCPVCKLPVFFVLGAADPMLTPYTRPLRDYYQTCGGHEIVWQTLPGVTHEGILDVLAASKAREVLGWLLARPAACDLASVDAGVLLDDADAGDAIDSSVAIAPPSSAIVLPVPNAPQTVAPIARGCTCGVGSERDAPFTGLAIAFGLCVLTMKRRRVSSRNSVR